MGTMPTCSLHVAQVDLQFISVILERLYLATNTTDLFIMISRASVIKDEEVRESLYCLKKLIQLNASGYIDPPIDFSSILTDVVYKCSRNKKEVQNESN